jgi:hypothetical protein
MTKIMEHWTKEIDSYIFVITNSSLTMGEVPITTTRLPMLVQSIKTVNVEGNVTYYKATRNYGETNIEAVEVFCSSVPGLALEPFYSECIKAVAPMLRYEHEVGNDELPKVRLY